MFSLTPSIIHIQFIVEYPKFIKSTVGVTLMYTSDSRSGLYRPPEVYDDWQGVHVSEKTIWGFMRCKCVYDSGSIWYRKSALPFHINGRTLSLDRFNMHHPLLHDGSSVAPGFVPVTFRPQLRDHNHKATAASVCQGIKLHVFK
ncbi:hypothetical protein TNCV_4038601 [Trichonephila clavipes]|nr:hypothetical protein TNCV_4038601 [Trichonephila clavipes]